MGIELLLMMIVGVGVGRIGDILVGEKRRKEKVRAITGQTRKKNNATPDAVELSRKEIDDIKEKVMGFYDRCRTAVFPIKIASEINVDEEQVKAALSELVREGKVNRKSGFYGTNPQ